MADKWLNIRTMEEEILNNPEVYQTTFMARCNKNLDSIYYIAKFIGKDKIQGLQMMDGNTVLVTMNNVDDMNGLLASVSGISLPNQPYSNITFIPVLPVHACLRIKISGIPGPLTSGNLEDITELFIEAAKELKEVVLSLEKEEDIHTGNLIVDALTDDLKMSHENLKSNVGIKYQNFHGNVKLIESFAVREENRGQFKANSDIILKRWE